MVMRCLCKYKRENALIWHNNEDRLVNASFMCLYFCLVVIPFWKCINDRSVLTWCFDYMVDHDNTFDSIKADRLFPYFINVTYHIKYLSKFELLHESTHTYYYLTLLNDLMSSF